MEIFNRYSLNSKIVKHKSLENLRGGKSRLIQEGVWFYSSKVKIHFLP